MGRLKWGEIIKGFRGQHQYFKSTTHAESCRQGSKGEIKGIRHVSDHRSSQQPGSSIFSFLNSPQGQPQVGCAANWSQWATEASTSSFWGPRSNQPDLVSFVGTAGPCSAFWVSSVKKVTAKHVGVRKGRTLLKELRNWLGECVCERKCLPV